MRISAIPIDGTICIDGQCYLDLDLSWMPVDVHAIQWMDDHGEIEFIDTSPNRPIDKLGIFEKLIDVFNAETQRLKYEEAYRYGAILRENRNYLLNNCDWTQLPDAPLNLEQIEQWKIYRQKLRDLPENTENPREPVWPTPPSET
jgi:hypothetical protein